MGVCSATATEPSARIGFESRDRMKLRDRMRNDFSADNMIVENVDSFGGEIIRAYCKKYRVVQKGLKHLFSLT